VKAVAFKEMDMQKAKVLKTLLYFCLERLSERRKLLKEDPLLVEPEGFLISCSRRLAYAAVNCILPTLFVVDHLAIVLRLKQRYKTAVIDISWGNSYRRSTSLSCSGIPPYLRSLVILALLAGGVLFFFREQKSEAHWSTTSRYFLRSILLLSCVNRTCFRLWSPTSNALPQKLSHLTTPLLNKIIYSKET